MRYSLGFPLAISLVIILSACDRSADNEADDTSENASAATDLALEAADESYSAANDPNLVTIDDRAYVKMAAKWDSPVIPVCWENPAPSDSDSRALVKAAVEQTWERHSAVNFIGWGSCASNAEGIRIRVADEGPHTKGLGNELNGKPAGMLLNFTFGAWKPACMYSDSKNCMRVVAVHEFGHALAFAHEHNRPDTPGECTKPKQGSHGDTILTPYDPKSVMNYCDEKSTGILSDFDRISVATVYGSAS